MADQDNITKLCNKCGEIKNKLDFNKSANSANGLRSNCRLCQKLVRRDWYLKNRDREIKKSLLWTKENPEKARLKDIRRNKLNPCRTSNQAKAWRLANPELAKELSKNWKKNNKDKVNKSARESYKKNPEKYLLKLHRRRELVKSFFTAFTKHDIDSLILKQQGKCIICKILIYKKFHRDHIIPLALGGTNDKNNIQILCPSCNSRKAAKDPITFMQENGFLI